jgi:hypothetical protein
MQSCFLSQIAGDEPEGGWAKWTFRFKSRRLENFVIAVEVERLDQSSVSASVAQGQVQRMVQSVQENADEKQGARATPESDTLAAFVVRMPEFSLSVVEVDQLVRCLDSCGEGAVSAGETWTRSKVRLCVYV